MRLRLRSDERRVAVRVALGIPVLLLRPKGWLLLAVLASSQRSLIMAPPLATMLKVTRGRGDEWLRARVEGRLRVQRRVRAERGCACPGVGRRGWNGRVLILHSIRPKTRTHKSRTNTRERQKWGRRHHTKHAWGACRKCMRRTESGPRDYTADTPPNRMPGVRLH